MTRLMRSQGCQRRAAVHDLSQSPVEGGAAVASDENDTDQQAEAERPPGYAPPRVAVIDLVTREDRPALHEDYQESEYAKDGQGPGGVPASCLGIRLRLPRIIMAGGRRRRYEQGERDDQHCHSCGTVHRLLSSTFINASHAARCVPGRMSGVAVKDGRVQRLRCPGRIEVFAQERDLAPNCTQEHDVRNLLPTGAKKRQANIDNSDRSPSAGP